MEHRARKRFGQNFLHDMHVIQRIVDCIHPQHDQHLVEIGPGKGALTSLLLEKTKHLDVVELDRDLVKLLQERFFDQAGLAIHSADALKFDFCSLATDNFPLRVVGNLPYNISTPLIFHLLDQRHCIHDMHFMLQKEVVERMAAQPGSKAFGRLSIMVQIYCKVEKLFKVAPGAFTPAPRVDSMIVRLTPCTSPASAPVDHKCLQDIVTQAFSQRRKTLKNTLKKLVTETQIQSLGLDPASRPETLSVQDFVKLADLLARLRREPIA